MAGTCCGAIINPLGKVLAGPSYEGETILTTTIDLNEIERGKFDFDVAGHYSRPNVFQLIVNESATRPVTTVVNTPQGRSS